MSSLPEQDKLEEKRYFIFTMEKGKELDRGKNGWLTYMGKDATAISVGSLKTALNSAIRRGIKCVVAVHAHGAGPSLQTKGQSIYTRNPGERDEYDNEGAYLKTHTEAQMNAKEFSKYLVDNELPKETKELRILACYTDKFSEDLAQELALRGYENTTVVGYKGEFSICQGANGSPLAGLDPDSTPELYEDGEVDWQKLKGNILKEYAADKYEARFNSSAYFIRKEEEDIKQSLLSSAPPPLESHYGSTTASPSKN